MMTKMKILRNISPRTWYLRVVSSAGALHVRKLNADLKILIDRITTTLKALTSHGIPIMYEPRFGVDSAVLSTLPLLLS
jgi:hypothetical protein